MIQIRENCTYKMATIFSCPLWTSPSLCWGIHGWSGLYVMADDALDPVSARLSTHSLLIVYTEGPLYRDQESLIKTTHKLSHVFLVAQSLSMMFILSQRLPLVNTLRATQNGCHFADDIFKFIFLNGNVWILLQISLKFVPKVWINNIPALVQIMAWRQPGDKPLSEPMMVSLTHICVTWPQWVKTSSKGGLRLCLPWHEWVCLVLDQVPPICMGTG